MTPTDETINALKRVKSNLQRARHELDQQLKSIQQQIDSLLPTEQRVDRQELDEWFAQELAQATEEARCL